MPIKLKIIALSQLYCFSIVQLYVQKTDKLHIGLFFRN